MDGDKWMTWFRPIRTTCRVKMIGNASRMTNQINFQEFNFWMASPLNTRCANPQFIFIDDDSSQSRQEIAFTCLSKTHESGMFLEICSQMGDLVASRRSPSKMAQLQKLAFHGHKNFTVTAVKWKNLWLHQCSWGSCLTCQQSFWLTTFLLCPKKS